MNIVEIKNIKTEFEINPRISCLNSQYANLGVSLKNDIKWVYTEELNRYIPVFKDILEPDAISTKLFFKLISNLYLKDKKVLELGCGSGALSISLARAGAKLCAVDILPSAAINSYLSFETEFNKALKKNIEIKVSDIYSNINEVNKKNEKFDIVIFNNPLISGIPFKAFDRMGYAGHGFEVPIRAISNLSRVLNKDGEAYFLTAEINERKSILNKFKSFCGYSSLEEIYFTDSTFKKIVSYIEPGMKSFETEFKAATSSNINFKIMKVKFS